MQETMKKIGPIQFLELPQLYQDQFKSGRIAPSTQFFAFKPSETSILFAVFLSIIYLLPALGLIFYGIPTYIFRNPEIIARLIRDILTGRGPFLILTVILGVIFGGLFWMLWMGWLALKNGIFLLNAKRSDANNVEAYGLLFDTQNLVIRHGDHFDHYLCAFLPKEMVTESFADIVRVNSGRHAIDINVVKIWYMTENKLSRELVLNEHFGLSAAEMQQMISDWRQV
jgi:hypothetical protein